jgi:2-oxoglutarate ferredoxin oxidoreductase subunit delta
MGYIVIKEERCKGCEVCTAACPEHVIAMAERFNAKGYRPATLDDPQGRCTGCTLCARMCPDVAIEVYR